MTDTTKSTPWETARAIVWGKLTPALEAAGYTVVAQRGYGSRLDIARNGVTLGTLDPDVSMRGENVHGDVRFSPNRYERRASGTYKVAPSGAINTATLLRRLAQEVLTQQRRAEAQIKADARDAADDKIEASLPKVPGTKITVFAGSVDLCIDGITPDMAAKVLALLETK